MNRYISTEFWEDEWIAEELTFAEKGFYLYLLTNPLTNAAGVYKLTMRRMIFDTGLTEAEIEPILHKFEQAGKVYRYQKYIILPTWCKHQRLENKNMQCGVERILKELDTDLLLFLKEVGYTYPLDAFLPAETEETECADEAEAEETECADEAEAEEKTEKGKRQEDKRAVNEQAARFLELWKETKDNRGCCIFQTMSRIENPKDWKQFWTDNPPSIAEIETAFRNFADGINSGAIERRFISSTPDRFVLKGNISRYQTPVIARDRRDGENDMLAGKIQLR